MAISDYGARFLPKESIAEIIANFQEGRKVRVAGRIMLRRDMGKSTFADVKDEFARIQTYAKKDLLGEEKYKEFKDLGLGDIIGLEGELSPRNRARKPSRSQSLNAFQRLSEHSLKNGTVSRISKPATVTAISI